MRAISLNTARWTMVILVVLETACGTYFTKNNLEYFNFTSVMFFVCGLMIAILPIFRYSSSDKKIISRNNLWKQLLVAAFFIWALWYAIPHIYWVFDWFKIDYHNADMIPQIQVSCRRWMAGETVYAPMPEIWGGMMPTYLPMMWIPYAPLVKAGVDPRWTTVFFFFVGIALLMWMLARSTKITWIQLILVLAIMVNLVFIQTDYNRTFFAWTQEGLVVAYYLFLGFALSKNNPWLTGIAIVCCLLSRYALFFWIPFYLFFQFFTGNRKRAIIEAGVILVLTTIIFIIPYFIKDPLYFLELPEKYSSQVRYFWTESRQQILRSLGLAKFFSIDQFRLLHTLQLILAIMIPLIFYSVIYRYRKSDSINLAFAGLCGLKLTLVFFYNFLEAPQFYYLFMVPIFFSYAILFHFLSPQSHAAKVA